MVSSMQGGQYNQMCEVLKKMGEKEGPDFPFLHPTLPTSLSCVYCTDEQGVHACVSLDDTLNIRLLTRCAKMLRQRRWRFLFSFPWLSPKDIPQDRLVRPHGKVSQQSRRGQTQTKEGNASKSLLFWSLGQKSKVPLSQTLSSDASGEPQP